MYKKVFWFFVILISVFIVWASVYSYNRNRIINHNTFCSSVVQTCAFKFVPASIWQMVTGEARWCFFRSCELAFPVHIPPGDQSATTTPCLEIPHTSTSSSTEPASTNEQFSFGELSNMYSYEKLGFSFQYPNELLLTKKLKDGCSYFTTSANAKSAFWSIVTPDCSLYAKLSSLEDYSKDFFEYGIEDTRLDFSIISSESFKTKSGLTGLYQVFSIKSSGTLLSQVRKQYVFEIPKRGFLILLRSFDDQESKYYTNIEKSVVESLIIK